jgi:L-arabinose isomerase
MYHVEIAESRFRLRDLHLSAGSADDYAAPVEDGAHGPGVVDVFY